MYVPHDVPHALQFCPCAGRVCRGLELFVGSLALPLVNPWDSDGGLPLVIRCVGGSGLLRARRYGATGLLLQSASRSCPLWGYNFCESSQITWKSQWSYGELRNCQKIVTWSCCQLSSVPTAAQQGRLHKSKVPPAPQTDLANSGGNSHNNGGTHASFESTGTEK